MTSVHLGNLWLDVNFWELVKGSEPLAQAVMGFLLMFSLVSWTIIFSKWATFRRARNANLRFLRLFRKASRLDAVAAATEQYRAAPLVTVFDFGYSEVARQISARSRITNPVAVERTLQLGISEEMVNNLKSSMQNVEIDEYLNTAREYLKSGSKKATSYAKEHPGKVAAGVAVLAVGAGLLISALNRD